MKLRAFFLFTLFLSYPLASQETEEPAEEQSEQTTTQDDEELGLVKDIQKEVRDIREVLKGLKMFGQPEAENDKKTTNDHKIKFHWDLATKEGWSFNLDLGANLDLTVNLNATGLDRGQTTILGGKVTFVPNYLNGDHEFRNKVEVELAYSKAPDETDWLKSDDFLEIESSYFWSPGKWWGLLGQLTFNSSMLPGKDTQSSPVTYQIVDTFGNPVQTIPDVTELVLDGAFVPFNMDQFVGMYVRPLKIKALVFEFSGGAFAHETFADNQLKVIEQSGSTVTVKELENYTQFGPFVGTNILGVLDFLGINYSVECKLKYAMYNENQVSLDPQFTDRLSLWLETSIGLAPLKSLGVKWDMRARIEPNNSRGFQLESDLFLNLPLEL